MRAGYKVASNLVVAEFPLHRVTALARLGFSFVGCLEKKSSNEKVTTRVALFAHKENEDSAHLGIVRSSLATHYLLVFATRFQDGVLVETSDSYQPPVFRPKPNFRNFRFPQIRSQADLYLLHRLLAKEHADTRVAFRIAPEDLLSTFIHTAEEIHSENMAQRDWKLALSGEHYKLAWRGALRLSVLRAWPVASIRRIVLYKRAEKKCRQLGYLINPKFGRLEPIRKPTSNS